MKKLATITIIVLLILVIIVGSVIIYIMKPSKPVANENNGYVYSTGESFLTNLKDCNRYVKTDILLEVSDKATLDFLEKNNYIIRDQIIDILGNIEEEDIDKEGFKEDLRDILREDLQSILKTDKIEGVYFNEFIIQ